MKAFTFLFLICGFAGTSFAQTDSLQILEINKVKTQIKDSISTYQELDKAEEAGGGYRHAYLKNKELVLTIIYHNEQNIDKYVEWYFSNGQMLYSEQIWTNTKTGKIVDDEKFYFVDGRLFAWIKMDGRHVNKDSRPFKNFDSGLEAYAIKLQADAR